MGCKFCREYISQLMDELIKKNGAAYVTDIAKTPEQIPVIIRLMDQICMEYPKRFVKRKDKDGLEAYINTPPSGETFCFGPDGIVHSQRYRDLALRQNIDLR